MDETKKRVRLTVTGIVQGVFFRAETRRAARELALNGFVRNLPDSSVEVVAEGAPTKVEKLIEWCRKGPDLARVDNVRIHEEKPTGAESGFTISY